MMNSVAVRPLKALNFKVAIVSLLAAVAIAIPAIGGTQADFTAVTTNPGNSFQAATLTMTTDSPASAFVSIENMIPGDSATRSVTVENSGSVPFTYAVSVSNEGGPPSLMWSDEADGLQLSVSGPLGVIYSGHVAGMSSVESGIEVAAGGSEVLTYVFSLPQAAGNEFQGLSQGISVTYDATQLAGAAR